MKTLAHQMVEAFWAATARNLAEFVGGGVLRPEMTVAEALVVLGAGPPDEGAET